MIKGKLGKAALIGLSFENMSRLQKGQPINFNLAEIGLPPQEIIIVGGEDEAAILADIEKTLKEHGL